MGSKTDFFKMMQGKAPQKAAEVPGARTPLVGPDEPSSKIKPRTNQDTVVAPPDESTLQKSRRTAENDMPTTAPNRVSINTLELDGSEIIESTEVGQLDKITPTPVAVPDIAEPTSRTHQLDVDDGAFEFMNEDEEREALFNQWKSQGLSVEQMADQLWHIMYDTNNRIDTMEEAMTAAFGEGKEAEKAEKRITQMMQRDTDKNTVPTIDAMYKWVQDMMQTKIRLQAMQSAWSRFEKEHINPVITENNDLRERVAQLERKFEGQGKSKKGWFRK